MPTIYVLSKNMKISENNSTENCNFYRHEKSLYIAWACFRNELEIIERICRTRKTKLQGPEPNQDMLSTVCYLGRQSYG